MLGENNIILNNGVKMPLVIQGLSLLNNSNLSFDNFYDVLCVSIKSGIRAFDTSHAYGDSEKFTGKAINQLLTEGRISRDELFITTKIDNEQQYSGDIEQAVDDALQTLRLEYLDCMLLHWPLPNKYIDNWDKLTSVYKKGKVKSIGFANMQERHLDKLIACGAKEIPHIIQIEHHPFYTNEKLCQRLLNEGIGIQAYSSLCRRVSFVTENEILRQLAQKYGVSIASIILRWDIQRGIAPIFRSFNPKHIHELLRFRDIELSKEEITDISNLNINYKFHPESVCCPGY